MFFQFQKSQAKSRSQKRDVDNNTVYIKGRNFKTVFILGAGATRGAIRHVILNRKRLKPPLNSDFFKIARTYAQTQGANSADNSRLKRLNLFFRDYLPINWIPNRISSNINLTHIHLLKLHGSINWFVRGSFSDLSAIFAKKPARVENPRKNEIRGYIRQIVPPIYGKFFGHDHWRNLWLEAYRSLCESEILVVIGCSLVETDFHLRALLSRVSKWRKNRSVLFKRVIFVDRSRVRRKWARVLKGSCSKVSNYPSFEVFLRKELKV